MKGSRNERLSEHLLNVDEELLATAYEIDNAEKLKAYKKTKPAPVTLLRRRVWVPVAAAAACVALTVGLWQGGVFDPAEIPVEVPNEGTTTTEPTESTTKDSAVAPTTEPTEPTDEPTNEPTDTTTDTEQPDTNDTKKPTATDKTEQPTKTEKPATSVTGDTDKTEPTKTEKPTTVKTTPKPTTKPTATTPTKPTTKPTTGKTEPTNTTATTEKEWPVIMGDAPDIPVDEYPDMLCPLLKIKMEQYKGVDVKYSVIVEVCYPNKERDYEAFLQSHENLAQVHKEYYDLNDALEAEAKRISPNYPDDIIWNDKMREIDARMDEILNEMIALEDKYFDAFAVKLWDQRMETIKKIAGTKLVPISTDSKYTTHIARNTNEAFFMELTTEEIKALEKDGGFLMRLKYPGGDSGLIDS